MKKDNARPWMAKFQETQKQPSSQTQKANALRHEPAPSKGKSPLQRFMSSRKKTYGNVSKGYDVGRTRRAA